MSNDFDPVKFATEAMSAAMVDAKAEARAAEERAAWDRYAAAAMDIVGGTHRNEFAATAAKVADEMLVERRKRFGGGA